MIPSRPLSVLSLVLVASLASAALLPGAGLRAARADEPSGALPVPLEHIELLPVHELEWALLLQDHRDLVVRLKFLGDRLEKVRAHLEARDDPNDAGSQKLQAEIRHVLAALRPPLERLLAALRPLGIDEEVLAVLDGAPRGVLRQERQALRVVLAVPGLGDAERALFTRLVPAVEGALLALAAAQADLGDDDVLPEAARAALKAGIERRIRELQKRFWRVADATLTRAQRAAVRRRLPAQMAKHADLVGHLYTLPGLSASQATRLKALLVRLEAEAAPDAAVVARVDARLGTKEPSAAERRRLEAEKQDAELRNVARMVAAWREGRSVLDAAQRAELDALPPLLAAAERPGDLEALVKELRLTPDQAPALADLHRRYGPAKGRLLQRVARIARMEKRYGPDAPEAEMVPILRAQAYAEALAEARKAAHELFTEVLTADQIVGWVLGTNPR